MCPDVSPTRPQQQNTSSVRGGPSLASPAPYCKSQIAMSVSPVGVSCRATNTLDGKTFLHNSPSAKCAGEILDLLVEMTPKVRELWTQMI